MPRQRARFGNVRKLPSGRWQARYKKDGAWHTAPRTFPRQQNALDWLDDQNTDRRRGDWIDPKKGRVTFAQWAERWKATTVGLREATRVRDHGYLDWYAIPAFGDVQLGSIDHVLLEDWVAALSKERAPATVAKALQLVRRVLQNAVAAGMIATDPSATVKAPKVEREEMRFLSVEEVDALADAIDPRYRAVVYVGAYGGLRMSEIFGLRWARVDLGTGQLRITENLVEVDSQLYTAGLKTRASRRTVTLPQVARRELELVPTDDEYVWTAPKGGPVRLNTWRPRVWAPAVKQAGLGHVRPHDLRHTCAALMIAAGAQPLEVSRRLGHTSVRFTLDTYGHLMPSAEGSLNDSLDRLASASGTAVTRNGSRTRKQGAEIG